MRDIGAFVTLLDPSTTLRRRINPPEADKSSEATGQADKRNAAITYYLANRKAVDAYLERVKQGQEEASEEQERHPSEFVRMLRERINKQRQTFLKERRQSATADEYEDGALFILL